MPRFRKWIGSGMTLALLLSLLAAGGRWLSAAGPAPAIEPSPISFVLDVSPSMTAELESMVQAWELRDVQKYYDEVIAGHSFPGTQDPLPPTGDGTVVQSWLEGLQPAGDGDCPDPMLQALVAASGFWGSETVNEFEPGERALLLSDSAPEGGQGAVARVAGQLIRQDTAVYPVQSGWCWGETPLPMSIMKRLALITGGTALPVVPGVELVHNQMALNLVASSAGLLLTRGAVSSGEPHSHPFAVDSTVESITLHIAADDDWWWSCQSCDPEEQPATAHSPSAGAPFPFEIRLQQPDGSFISSIDPRVRLLETGYAIQFDIHGTPEDPLLAGIWQLHVGGDGSYEVRIAAGAGIQIAYLGPHTVPAGQPVNLEIALASKGDTHVLELVEEPLTSIFLPLAGGPPIPGPDLYHDDWAVAAGFFTGGDNGVGELPDAAYHLVIRGRLQDGTPLQRVVPAPIRARDVQLRSPAGGAALPGDTVVRTFTLSNEGAGSRSYELLAESSQGWAETGAVPPNVTLAPGETRTIEVPVHISEGAPSGTVEETTLTATGEDLLDSETATVRTTAVDTLHVYLSLVRND